MAISGKQYSRESYDEAVEEREKRAKEHAEILEDVTPDTPSAEWPHRGKAVRKAAKRVENLYSAGQEEATELNAEHYRLQQAVKDAQKELHDFEKNKLGMHQENKEIE